MRAIIIAIFATLPVACTTAAPIVSAQENRVMRFIHFEANNGVLQEFSEIMSV